MSKYPPYPERPHDDGETEPPSYLNPDYGGDSADTGMRALVGALLAAVLVVGLTLYLAQEPPPEPATYQNADK